MERKTAPLYYQVEEYIKNQIESGKWGIGTKIPTEIQLMEQFHISRATLRHAITNLEVEGLIEKRQGYGTFVTSLVPFEQDPTQVFIQGVEGHEHTVLDISEHVADERISKHLSKPSDTLYSVFRYFHHSKESEIPFNLVSTYIPEKTYPGFRKYFLTDTLYNISKNKYSINLKYAKSHVKPVELYEECAGYFNVHVHTPAIKIRKIYYDYNDAPVFLSELYLNPNNSVMELTTLPTV